VRKTPYAISILLAMLTAAPSVFAVGTISTGISPLNNAFQLIGNLFNFQLQGAALAGVLKFLILVLLFTVLNTAARNFVWKKGEHDPLNKRTANIVSLTLAFMSVVFVPDSYLLNVSSAYVSVILLLLILGIPGLIVWFAFKFGAKSDTGEERGFFRHFVGFLACAAALGVLATLWNMTLGGGSMNGSTVMTPIINTVLSYAEVAISIAMIVKLLQAMFAIGGAKGVGGDDYEKNALSRALDGAGNVVDSAKNLKNKLFPDDPNANKWPRRVNDVQFAINGQPDANGFCSLKITWTANPEADEVEYYIIRTNLFDERTGISYADEYLDKHFTAHQPLVLVANSKHGFNIHRVTLIQVRAINKYGNKGEWGSSKKMKPEVTPSPVAGEEEQPHPQPAKQVLEKIAQLEDLTAKLTALKNLALGKLDALRDMQTKTTVDYGTQWYDSQNTLPDANRLRADFKSTITAATAIYKEKLAVMQALMKEREFAENPRLYTLLRRGMLTDTVSDWGDITDLIKQYNRLPVLPGEVR